MVAQRVISILISAFILFTSDFSSNGLLHRSDPNHHLVLFRSRRHTYNVTFFYIRIHTQSSSMRTECQREEKTHTTTTRKQFVLFCFALVEPSELKLSLIILKQTLLAIKSISCCTCVCMWIDKDNDEMRAGRCPKARQEEAARMKRNAKKGVKLSNGIGEQSINNLMSWFIWFFFWETFVCVCIFRLDFGRLMLGSGVLN